MEFLEKLCTKENWSKFDWLKIFLSSRKRFNPVVSRKEVNGYIDIEYSSIVGEFTLKRLLSELDKNKKFHQAFLKRYERIRICHSDEYEYHFRTIAKTGETKEIFLDECSFSHPMHYLSNLLYNVHVTFGYALTSQFKGDDIKVPVEDYLYFLISELLKKYTKDSSSAIDTNVKASDYYLYGDDAYYRILTELAFKFNRGDLIADSLKSETSPAVREFIFQTVYEKYSINLVNSLFERQKNRIVNTVDGEFCLQNMGAIYNLISAGYWMLEEEDVKVNERDILRVSKEDIIKLVIEFLSEIDETKTLVIAFIERLNNGTIILWNPNNQEEREQISSLLNIREFEDINEACVLSGNIINVPLEYTLNDVWTIVHEFAHVYFKKSGALLEFPSIYFEELAKKFLVKKGYSSEEFDMGFRVSHVLKFEKDNLLCVLFYFDKYLKYGHISKKILNEILEQNEKDYIAVKLENGLTMAQIQGEIDSVDREECAKMFLYYLNAYLANHQYSVVTTLSYSLGIMFTVYANKKDYSVQDMINLFSEVDDIFFVMRRLGIETETYGFIEPTENAKEKVLK